ncbi:conserved hypothetical protein [Desulforamulus reducens MI-1]|uniref:Nucleotidase n=1 Tax=Desulforamulus reducens (strain ATCC BAA-1160 / DSM 100696 / MI-1) TaxID=349161 RepID=A4J8L9_DESRM|nr:HAD hydrolase-like protein [Desulforamulus reducens]ABO51422.1 conserved hypothetical protein [Desulforamulus reducens MI-1]
MRIGIDLDGTIADNLELLVQTMNHYCSKDLCGEEIYQYNLCEVYNIKEEQFIQLMEEKEEEIIIKSPIISFASESIHKLVLEGWEVHIITARSPRYQGATEKWLQEKEIPFTGLHLLDSHNKLEICQQLGVKLMVEDNIHNAYQLNGGGIPIILFDAPHNRHWPWQGIRCKSWQEIYSFVKNHRFCP